MTAMKNTKKQSLAEKLLDYKPRSKEDLAYLDKFFKIVAGRKGISIVRTNSDIAAWNPDTDVIYLPVFTTDDKDIYLMMGSHEISHAKNTPKTFYKEHNDKKTGKKIVLTSGKQISRKLFSCINIVEDIRIEKLIRQQFPGFVANYRNAYRKLLDYPAFATYKNLTQEIWETTFTIADRINAKAKFGSNIPFPLNDKEYAVLKYCASAKTFDEVLVRAIYLHSLLIEEQEQKMPPMGSSTDGEQQDQQGGSGDQGNTGDNPSDENLTSEDFKDSTDEGNNQQNQKDSQSGEKNSDKNGDQQNNEKSENGQQKSNKDNGNSSSPDGSDSNDSQPSDELNGNQSQNQSGGSGEQSDGNFDGTEDFNGDLSNMMDNLNKEGQSIDKQNSNPSNISNSPKLDEVMKKLQKMIEDSYQTGEKNESNVTDKLMEMISDAANSQLSESGLTEVEQAEFADEQLEAEKAEEEFKNTENSGDSKTAEIYRTNDYFTAVSW